MDKHGVVAMRLFANWEIDRTSSSVVQRVFNLSINRLVLTNFPEQVHSLVITTKLQGHKRTLRSNEIAISSLHGTLDIDLDISFTIQYPHFLKRKTNCLQILIQRRRKYKNRPIPGGFKTLAIGLVNLTQLLQQGSLREISLWNSEGFMKDTVPNVQSIGRLSLTSCQSQPIDGETSVNKEKALGELSEDSESEEDDEGDQPADSDNNEGRNHRMLENRVQMRHKLAHRKNLKQKFVSLLRKFKVPEEEETQFPSSVSASLARAPTAKELEALFEELDDLSDSGPEGIAADEMSIGSNPRPALRPYFSREMLPGLPAILDDRASESDVDPDDLEWSSEQETEKAKDRKIEERIDGNMETTKHKTCSGSQGKDATGDSVVKVSPIPRACVQPTLSEKLSSTSRISSSIPHSLTAGSITSRVDRKTDVGRNASIGEQLSSIISDTSSSSLLSERVWLCSLADLPLLQTLSTISSVLLVNCPTAQQVKCTLTQIVAKIQNFCNSNSSPPPVTWIGVVGNDRLVSQVVRAYVDAVQHKSSSQWLHCIRFALIVPPNSLIGRLLAGLDTQLDLLARDIWERSADITIIELKQLADRLLSWPSSACGCVNLPIGEALLQMSEKEGQSVDSSRLFVPFLAEVRVGQVDDVTGEVESTVNSPRDEVTGSKGYSEKPELVPQSGSPPSSPYSRHDIQEMHVEYWLGNNNNNENLCLPPTTFVTTPNRKEGKGSLKTTFRTLLVTRACAQPLLALTFVKEKRKEKMLQKLGMKNRQKSEPENSPVQVGNLSRLLCSGTGKHNRLAVYVDGVMYSEVRFFQTSSQWPTHVRSLPISLTSPVVNLP